MIEFYLMAVAGVVIHSLSKIAKLEMRGGHFSFRVWIGRNKFRTLLSITGALALTWVHSHAGDIHAVNALLYGVAGDAVLKNLMPASDPPPPTTTI